MDGPVRALIRWSARHALSLVVIVLVLIVGRYVLQPAFTWLKAEARQSEALPRQRATYDDALRRYRAYAAIRLSALQEESSELAGRSVEALRARQADIPAEIRRRQQERLGRARLAFAGISGDGDAVFRHYRAGAEISLLEHERRSIETLLLARDRAAREDMLGKQRKAELARMTASRRTWNAARERAAALDSRPLAGARNAFCRRSPLTVGCENYRALMKARRVMQAAAADNRAARASITKIDAALSNLGVVRTSAADVGAVLHRQGVLLGAERDRLRDQAGNNWLLWIKGPIIEVLPTALAILAAAILLPPAVKALLYFCVAPLASRRPAVRLLPEDRFGIGEAGPSAASQRVPLNPGEELLALPEAIQSSPHHAEKRTQWLLRRSMPLSSIAAGMVALVRLRVHRPDTVALYAFGDPLGEIARITIPAGSALVLRPRALVGLVQTVGNPVRITRRWRLGHLSAWLTLQFRYLIFHGPCECIVRGSRGVRVVSAGDGRGTNQANTLGFSPGLRYGVRRSEAFGAYLIGKQELFNDSFEGKGGSYLYEELPLERCEGGLWGRGLRGLGDAALKAFGL